MKKLKTSYKIENKFYSFIYCGKTFKGKDKILLDDQDNLLENVNFDNRGYHVVNLDKTLSHKTMKSSCTV